MKGFELILTLLDDCVFSERSATEGGHRGLDYIPGAAILGAAAGRLYRKLSAEDAFTLFHSGQVRFGNGRPLGAQGERSWPVPFCWHQAKGAKAEPDGRLIRGQVWRLGNNAELPNNQQPQQLRQGYVTASGALLRPVESLRLKTAIDPDTGRAREAALFGYEALAARQAFAASITMDDAVSDALRDKLRDAFQKEILLGRSRSAEYGRVQVETGDFHPLPTGRGEGERIALWLLSDLAALDDLGQPTLAPRPEWLGLAPGKLVVEQSFVRGRRYSPWNAHRGGPDLERQVLAQGSVLVFGLNRVLNDEEKGRITKGLGAFREAGLGQVWLDPELLGQVGGHPEFEDSEKTTESTVQADSENLLTSNLVRWLEKRATQGGERSEETQEARRLAREYIGLLALARRLKGVEEKDEIGPSPSQWGDVLAKAKGPGNNFAQELFGEANGVCKPSAPGWKEEYWDADCNCTRNFACWLHNRFGQTPTSRFVQHLAREIMAEIKKENRR